MAELKDANRRVIAAAEALGLDLEIRAMAESTRTAEDAARACGCEVGQIVKSLVFAGTETERPVLILVSGANRVDESSVAADVGEPLKRPSADFVRSATGFAIGGIPPLGHAVPLPVFIDRDLLIHDTVWAAAGTPESVFAVQPQRLAKAIGAKVIFVC